MTSLEFTSITTLKISGIRGGFWVVHRLEPHFKGKLLIFSFLFCHQGKGPWSPIFATTCAIAFIVSPPLISH